MSKQLTTSDRLNAITEIIEDPETMALFDPRQGDRGLKTALKVAQSIDRMRNFMTDDVVKELSAGMNSPLGFMTDRPQRDKPAYTIQQLREPFIQMLLSGYLPANNEINIIAGQFYPAKNGLRRKCLDFPGVTDLQVIPGVPEMKTGGATVHVECSWKLNGHEDSLSLDLAIRLNAGMGADGAIGKAERKAYKRILEVLYGRELHDIPDHDEEALDAEAKVVAKEALTAPSGELFDNTPDATAQ